MVGHEPWVGPVASRACLVCEAVPGLAGEGAADGGRGGREAGVARSVAEHGKQGGSC